MILPLRSIGLTALLCLSVSFVPASREHSGLLTASVAEGQAVSRPAIVVTVAGRREASEAIVGTKAMRYLPFEVPEGVTRITIHREYDNGPDPTRKNTVDFGLFDNRGTETGIRGWQGGAAGDFVVTGNLATCSPHAIPGPLPAGRWYIAQYYLASAPAGLNYKYTVTFSFDDPEPPHTFPAPPRYDPGVLRKTSGWYAGNMHVHTLHSDGGRTLPDMVGRCASEGFDFIASTEHNSTTAHYRFAEASQSHPDVLLLYGDEFTTPGGHANIVGQKPGYWFDFRMDPGDGKLPAIIAEAHRQKAIVTVNHPFATCTTCTWRYPETEWEDADAIEVWNGIWSVEDRKAVDLWDNLLKAGHKVCAIGGTDYHRGDDPLVPATLVYAKNLSQAAIMDGLRKGHITLSESPKGPKLLLSTEENERILPGDTLRCSEDLVNVRVKVSGGMGKRLRLVWADGETTIPINTEESVVRYAVPSAQGGVAYLRAELLYPDGKMAALTNPLYLTGK